MKASTRNLMGGAALSALLSSCGGDSASAPTPSPPPSAMTLPQQIGAAFNALFTASPDTAEATDPAPSSVPSLDLTKEAIDG